MNESSYTCLLCLPWKCSRLHGTQDDVHNSSFSLGISWRCCSPRCTGLAPYSSDLHPVKDSYPSLPVSSDLNSPLVDDKASHDMSSHMPHRFSGVQEAHGRVVDNAIGVSSNVGEIVYLGSGNDGLGGQPLGNEDTRSSHALEGQQSALFPPSTREIVGIENMAHHVDEAPGHHPSPFHHHH